MQSVPATIIQPPSPTQVILQGTHLGRNVMFTVHSNGAVATGQGTIGIQSASIEAPPTQVTALSTRGVNAPVTIRWSGGYVMYNVAFL